MATFIGLFTNYTAGRQDGDLIAPGAWVTSTSYAVADMVSEDGDAYQCIEAHTSGTFATDLAADKWVLVAEGVVAFPQMALETPTAIGFRACASDLSDPGEDSTSTLSPVAPTGFTACFTEGGTYVAEPTDDAVIAHGGNQSLWIQQESLVESSPVGLVPGAETFTTGTRVGQVANLAASNDDAESVLTWDAIAGESGFIIEYCEGATDPGSGSWAAETGYTATTAAADAVTKTITGLTNGTQYQFRIRAWAATGLGAWSTIASATPEVIVATFTLPLITALAPVAASSWATVRGASSAASFLSPGNTVINIANYSLFNTDNNYYIGRVFFDWDTSSLPDTCTVQSATLTLTCLSYAGVGGANSVVTTSLTTVDNVNDFNITNYGASAVATFDATTSTNTAYTQPLNLSILPISKTGHTYMAMLGEYDRANTPPPGANRTLWHGPGATTESYRPVLTVYYST